MSDPRFLAPLSEGQVLAAKYVVGVQLGVGGMGVVHAAHDTELDRRVALKVLLPRLVASPTASERLKQEARAASRITSEHVVRLLDFGRLPDGAPFFVMEYLEGKDLRAVLREEGPLAPQRAVDYLLQALQAVAEGHLHGVIHRDLKPGNLFLTERADGTPLIKVLDFGIAKTLRPANPDDLGLTSSEDVQLGSPTYMPPEQFQNPRDVDARSDIWSLGVTLYELLSGQVPFQGRTYVELVSRVLKDPPEPFQGSRPGKAMPAGLEEILARCLEKDREKRFSNAVELAVALAPYGSEDARLSLTRVSGMNRKSTPSPNPVRYPADAYEATLPVPVEAALERAATETASGARPLVRPVPRRRLAWAAFGFAALGAGATVLVVFLVQLSKRAEPSPVVSSGRPLVTSLSAASASLLAPTARAPEAEPAPVDQRSAVGAEPASSVGTRPVVVEADSALSVAPGGSTPKLVPRRPGAGHGPRTEPDVALPAPGPAPPPVPPLPDHADTAASKAAASRDIEDLIQIRH